MGLHRIYIDGQYVLTSKFWKKQWDCSLIYNFFSFCNGLHVHHIACNPFCRPVSVCQIWRIRDRNRDVSQIIIPIRRMQQSPSRIPRYLNKKKHQPLQFLEQTKILFDSIRGIAIDRELISDGCTLYQGTASILPLQCEVIIVPLHNEWQCNFGVTKSLLQFL